MVDPWLTNKKPRIILIQRFDGSVFCTWAKRQDKKLVYELRTPLQEIRGKVAEFGWVVEVEHLQKKRIGHSQTRKNWSENRIVVSAYQYGEGNNENSILK